MRRGQRDSSPGGGIARLQDSLRQVGFGIVGPADGIFGRRTEWAVRELRIAAAHAVVALQTVDDASPPYAETLVPVPNDRPLSDPVTGVADDALLDTLAHWEEHGWRCPVVVEAWTLRDGRRHDLVADDVWLADEVPSAESRVFVMDLSGRWEVPDDRSDGGRVVLGYREPGGPNMTHRHAWPELEITPEALAGTAWEDLGPAERSTFRVVRAVSEQECLGYLDVMNAWDNAVLSTGPYHWTLAIDGRSGELPPLLAWYQRIDPAGWDASFGAFGLEHTGRWEAGPDGDDAHPSSLWRSGSRKFTGRVQLVDEDGSPRPIDGGVGEHEWLRSWHWLHRFVMHARTAPLWRRAVWDYSRMRLRDLVTTPLSEDAATRLDAASDATLGDVATSEVAMALVSRWHVRMPAHVCAEGRTGAGIDETLRRMAPPPLAEWGDDEQEDLIAALMEAMGSHVGADFARRMRTETASWPSWRPGTRDWQLDTGVTGPLRRGHRSFAGDTAGLP